MSAIEVLKEVSLELKNGTLGKDLELGHIEQLLEIGIYKLQKKGYFKNKKALLALEQIDNIKLDLKLIIQNINEDNYVNLKQDVLDDLKEVLGGLK